MVAEQKTENLRVVGSIPTLDKVPVSRRTNTMMGLGLA